MARVLGESGRYVTEQAIKKYRNQFIVLFIIGFVFAFVTGLLLGIKAEPYTLFLLLICLVLFLIVIKKVNRVVENLERQRLDFRRGATGEAIVGRVLDNFPDNYYVIHDIEINFGNIDHVVIGPSGIYIIDTKNWRGVVKADGNEELLLNERPTDKPEIKNLTRRIMSVREKIEALSRVKDPFIRGLLVFPSARIEAKWGTTGNVHCIKEEQLYNYIVESKQGKKLTSKEVDAFSRSFLALARMDKDFA